MNKKAILRLSDGTEFHGESFGYEGAVAGEVVFNTAMMGYPESLTDPSYAGQILVMTFPLVGNYGVPSESTEQNGLSTFMESDRIHVRALVVSDYSVHYSHWNAKGSLADWLLPIFQSHCLVCLINKSVRASVPIHLSIWNADLLILYM